VAETKGSKGKKKDSPTLRPAADRPVARVAVDIPLAHLDRPFDYLVPERLAGEAVPGVRVRVRFAGQLTDGFVLERVDASDHPGRLAWLDRVVSPERVLTEEIAGLARAVADRYAGTLADVLRLAIPPRHATVEGEVKASSALQSQRPQGAAGVTPAQEAGSPGGVTGHPRPVGGEAQEPAGLAGSPGKGGERGVSPPLGGRRGGEAPLGDTGASPLGNTGPWARYPAGPAFLGGVADGRPVRAAWTALPGDTWPHEIAIAVATAVAAGNGAVVVVPDARDLSRVDQALADTLGDERHVTLTADLGPAERYRRWLRALRGEVLAVAGTRAAMFAPVPDLGLVVLWDEGDDLHAEPRAPYPNAREVLALRAHRVGAAALLGGFARTPELAQLVASGWARDLVPERATIRALAPVIRAAADEYELSRDAAATTARLPSLALRTARAGLADGPVLVQVPRRGYLAAIACGRCRARARCPACGGPLRVGGAQEVPDCGWCGALAGGWKCPHCDSGQLRAMVVGAARTAEELGRAFPGVKVRTSGGPAVLPAVPDEPALVIATPGAEPLAQYRAALLLDGWALLARQSLHSEEEALRRWMAAAALVRPDGTVLIHADASLPVVQALIRWDPASFADRALADRLDLAFPPAVRMASVTGDADAVASLLAAIPAPSETQNLLTILGPVPMERSAPAAEAGEKEQVRALLRVPRADGLKLARALHAAQAARSARKEGGGVRVQLDPAELI
jgi:primosomal protein N' (replication factor Y) (superfamily II helicase)